MNFALVPIEVIFASIGVAKGLRLLLMLIVASVAAVVLTMSNAIRQLAQQTNLLALNAAIEAAQENSRMAEQTAFIATHLFRLTRSGEGEHVG